MRALITGVTGFVGRYLARHLVAEGHSVLGSSLTAELPTGDGSPDVELRAVGLGPWDVSQPPGPEFESQIHAFGPEVIFHLAAISIPAACGEREPTEQAWRANVVGTQQVLQLIERLQRPVRLVFVSSSHVYAPVQPGNVFVSESAALGPESGYAKTKLAAERLVEEAVRTRGLDAVIVRPFKHTGPGQSPQMMVPEWARQFAQGANPVLIRSRDSFVDLCDVRDVVRAYGLLATSKSGALIYNVGSGISRRTGDIFDALRDLADPDRAVQEVAPQIRYEPIADCSRIHAEVGWECQVPLRQTLLDTLTYWQARCK